MVTHYFANKDQLLAHTLALSVRSIGGAITAAVEDGDDGLGAIIEHILPLDEERSARWRLWLAFWGSAIGSAELTELQRTRQQELTGLLRAALRRRHGNWSRTAIQREAQRIVALLDGVAVQAIFAPGEWPPRRQLAFFDELLLDARNRHDGSAPATMSR